MGIGVVSGAGYRFVQVDNDKFSGAVDGATQFTNTAVFVVIGRGPVDNVKFQITSHVTVNANGDLTVEKYHAIGDCS